MSDTVIGIIAYFISVIISKVILDLGLLFEERKSNTYNIKTYFESLFVSLIPPINIFVAAITLGNVISEFKNIIIKDIAKRIKEQD